MTDEAVLQELAKFFLEDLMNDPAGVGDWLALGDYDVDAFIHAVERIASRVKD